MTNISDSGWINKAVSYNQCPKCKTGTLDTRISRGIVVKHLFFWVNVKRYRCSNCFAKVYIKSEAAKKATKS